MVEITVGVLTVLAAIITGIYTVKAVTAEKRDKAEPPRPVVQPRSNPRAPGPAPRPVVASPVDPRPSAPQGGKVLPLVRRKNDYAGLSDQELQIALLTDANFMLQRGDTFRYRETRNEVDPA